MKYLTTGEVAEILALSERSIRRLCAEGRIKHMKHGRVIRISEEDLDAYIISNTYGGNENDERN